VTGSATPSIAAPTLELLIVVPSFFPDVYGGVERQAEILAEAIGRTGWRVSLLAPTLRGPRVQTEATDFGEIVRLRVSALPARGGRYLKATIGWTLRSAGWILRRRRRFAGIYLLHHRLHAAGPLLAAWAGGLPVWVKPGGGGEASEFLALRAKKYLYGHLVAALVKTATTGFVANGRMIEDDLRREGIPPGRIVVLPNGVEAIAPEVFESALQGRAGARFVYAGRLVPDKRAEVLLQAAAELPPGDWSLTIMGGGSELERLKRLAGDLGLQARVHFTGPRDDVPRLLLDYDVFASASPREGQSNALLEAMAAGLIPICVRASGVDDLVGDGRGLVADAPVPEQLAALMGEVLAMDPQRRRDLQRHVQAYASQTLTIDSVAARTIALFSSTASEA
jgi:glycosyltransferase involved in cell wall biosynthesis